MGDDHAGVVELPAGPQSQATATAAGTGALPGFRRRSCTITGAILRISCGQSRDLAIPAMDGRRGETLTGLGTGAGRRGQSGGAPAGRRGGAVGRRGAPHHHHALDRAADDAGVAVGRGADRVGGATQDGIFKLAQRDHDAVDRPAEQGGVGARVGWGESGDLVGDLVDRFQVEVDPETQRQLDGDPPVLHGGTGGRDLPGQTQQAALEVRGGPPLLPGQGHGQEHMGGIGARRRKGVDGHDERRLGQRPAGQVAIGEVGQRVRPEEDQRLQPALGGGGQDAGGVEPPPGGDPAPGGLEPRPSGIERDPPGQEAGRQAEVESTVNVVAP